MTSSPAERGEERARGALRGALGLFLISPYLIWIARVPRWTAPDLDAWARVAARALTQAALSTVGASLGGWILFRALRALPAEGRRRGELRLLLPNAVPPLFVALAFFGVMPRAFPFGLGAVVAAHAWLNAGLIAVALERIARARLGQLAEAAWTMGVSERRFWSVGAWPLVRRDVVTLLFFTFTLCFTSFSLPLLLQGARDVSLEVAIYDLIRRAGRWDQAITLAALQAGVLFAASWLLPRAREIPRRPEPRALPYRPAHAWGWLTWIPPLLLAFGLARGLGGARWVSDPIFYEAWATTALIGAGVGAAQLLLLVVTAFVLPHARAERFLRGYMAPGPALTAFAALLVVPPGLAATIGALTLIGFAPLYRWQVHATLESLRAQWAVARTLGASPRRILTDVTWPQAAPAILNSCGLAAIWACGDFAVSGILLDQTTTLPQLIAARLTHYQWAEAYAVLPPLALTAGALYLAFGRLYVRD